MNGAADLAKQPAAGWDSGMPKVLDLRRHETNYSESPDAIHEMFERGYAISDSPGDDSIVVRWSGSYWYGNLNCILRAQDDLPPRWLDLWNRSAKRQLPDWHFGDLLSEPHEDCLLVGSCEIEVEPGGTVYGYAVTNTGVTVRHRSVWSMRNAGAETWAIHKADSRILVGRDIGGRIVGVACEGPTHVPVADLVAKKLVALDD